MARHAGLKGTYRAWLSELNSSPALRFTHSPSPYRLVTGVMVAASWTDLTDGSIEVPIDVTELGGSPSADADAGAHCHGPPDCTTVFTSTAADGTAFLQSSSEDCYDWTSLDHNGVSPSFSGGTITSRTNHWTLDFAGFECDLMARIYCFQQ